MSFRIFAICSLLALQVLRVLSSPAVTDTSEELVMTPGGLRPKANVHAIPEGARINHTPTEIQIIAADGTIIHAASRDKTPAAGGLRFLAPRDLNEGYVAYSDWKNTASSPISTFSTSWTVPPLPTHSDGQVLYIFNGLVPDSTYAILQPVLQYGVSEAGGGAYWTVASWFVDDATDNVYYTPLFKVSAGQDLTGVMKLVETTGSGSSTTYHWNCAFTGISSTSLTISTTYLLDWAYEALEIYYVTEASDLPTGTMTMSNIIIENQNGARPSTISWTAANDTTDKIYATILSTSSSNGAVKITYPLT